MTVRVLICDDVEDFRYLLRQVLALDPDLEVVGEAANGHEAVVKACELRPDVVLLDLSMPMMDGLEALPRIADAAPGANVIVLSGFDARGMARQAMDLGAVSYLEKGASPSRIADAVRAAGAMDARPSPAPAPTRNVVHAPPEHSDDTSELLALVRHELGSPLASALGLARLLFEAPERLQGREDETLGRVVRNLERLHGLVEGFEQLARIHDGTLELDAPSRTDLSTLLEDAVAEFRDRHPHRRVILDAPRGLEVEADLNLLPRAVQNLLANADKFSPTEGAIEVGATLDGDTVVAWVRDHGPGIPAAEVERVFERFVRLDHRVKGLGLGLYLTKTIVEAHGGRIRAEEHPDGGARFRIELPSPPRLEVAEALQGTSPGR